MSNNELDIDAVFEKLKELGAPDRPPKYATDFIVRFLARTKRPTIRKRAPPTFISVAAVKLRAPGRSAHSSAISIRKDA